MSSKAIKTKKKEPVTHKKKIAVVKKPSSKKKVTAKKGKRGEVKIKISATTGRSSKKKIIKKRSSVRKKTSKVGGKKILHSSNKDSLLAHISAFHTLDSDMPEDVERTLLTNVASKEEEVAIVAVHSRLVFYLGVFFGAVVVNAFVVMVLTMVSL